MKLDVRAVRWLAAALLAALGGLAGEAAALIIGEYGNKPTTDRGWPVGSLDLANRTDRVGWWEGPPFGGGMYTFLYRSAKTEDFNEALAVFAAIRAEKLELHVHDGPEESFWLKTGEQKEPRDPRVDWTFTVWIPANWHRLYNSPSSVFSADQPEFRRPVAAPRIDAHIGGGTIDWAQVKPPANVKVFDHRATAAPVKSDAGEVFQGTIYDMGTGKTIAGAKVSYIRRDQQNAAEEAVAATSDDQGKFLVENIPAGNGELWIKAAGYASRTLGHHHSKGKGYESRAVELAAEASLSGHVVDDDDRPLAGVEVSPWVALAIDGRGYRHPNRGAATTDDAGRFELNELPNGHVQLSCRKEGFHASPIHDLLAVPGDNFRIKMLATGAIRVQVVDREGQPAADVSVHLEQIPGGVGSWGGGANVAADGTYEFKGVPPGKYRLSLNPTYPPNGTETIEVVARKATEVKLKRE